MEKIVIRIDGEPKPNRKISYGSTKNGRAFPQDKGGKKLAWYNHVKEMCLYHMRKNNLEILPKGTPVLLGFNCWLTKSKNNKKPFPTQVPDYDNLKYVTTNAMKGIVYHDDCDVIGDLPGVKLWATDKYPQGIEIIIQPVLKPIEYESIKLINFSFGFEYK